jgi:hypothetical protein
MKESNWRYLFVTGIFTLLLVGTYTCITKSEFWKIEDVYGSWKVTRLIGAYKGTKGDLLYGDHIGRTFTITNENIIDSSGLESTIEEADGQICYSMQILKQDECVIDVSKQENLKDFQIESGIILCDAGIKENSISQYIFYAENREFNDIVSGMAGDYHMAPEFEVFSYSQKDKDKLIVSLPIGFYLLEGFRKQEKVENPYGFWMIGNLISRGNSGKGGIDFYNYYGQCFELSERYAECCGKTGTEVIWEKDLVFREDFEKKNNIQEGLGLENDKLEIWHGTGNDGFAIQLIPVNDDEIIISWEEQWFSATKVPPYEEALEDIEPVLHGDWKIVQLLGIGHVDEDKELWGREDYLAWWYTRTVTLDHKLYVKDAVTDWESAAYTASEFYKKFEVPENMTYLFKDDDILHIGIQKVYGIEEVYVLINKDTLIRGRNGLWYKLERF